ncbi:MAG: heparinase II/III domain-containing protein [Gemmatimonadaceae bacterium]
MLLLDPVLLGARRALVASGGALAPLADSIAADLEQLMARDLYIPREKALLSRVGGRCETDGTQLEFDPYSPDEHRCPLCGRVHSGEFHHRFWVYWYQLWLAERGVHAALIHLLRGDPRHGALARDIALRYCAMYDGYPNRDNVLGPTRLFFSTYIESIWLLQLCIMADLLEQGGDRATADEMRTKIVAPSAALICLYDEGMSNRQVWNNAAMMAAALLAGDRGAAERIVRAPSGVETHLAEGLLDDGSWYEGENYHLFAHRGLWYCVTLAETAGIEIDPRLLERFREGFATPFATALPDFTLPSRKDSQYAISLRQPRFAELCELGLARGDDDRLVGALAELYSGDVPRGDTNRTRSTADVERNLPGTSLTRADLGWRALLHARGALPSLERRAPRSAQLAGQGISVFRRDRGEVYVAFDWGQSGGGHGHPDRLNLIFAQGTTRWLDDLGTGSYVDRSLHWYRSTLAHNAPLINGHSQRRIDGSLLASDERGGVGWTFAEANGLEAKVRVTRAVIVTPDYFVDEIRWNADESVRFELPIHFDGEPRGVTLASGAVLDGGAGLEDGFEFATNVRVADLAAARPVELGATRDNRSARAFVCAEGAARFFRADGPGQPARENRTFHVMRCDGTHGAIRSVWAWSERVSNVQFAGEKIEVTLGAERHVHYQTDAHWQMELTVGGAQSGIELTGWTPGNEPGSAEREERMRPRLAERRPARKQIELPRGGLAAFELGEENYRRSESTWEEAGRPAARVTIGLDGDELIVETDVRTGDLVFVPANATNPYDNEHPDINGHSVQLYVRTFVDAGAWMIVPERGADAARVRTLEGWGTLEMRAATWEKTTSGFSIRARVALPPLPVEYRNGVYPVAVDVLVNETAPGRERRRGQLVMSGAQDEFVYLRGDRHDQGRLVPILIIG